MTPEEEAYEEALRRIRKAEKTGAVELDLGGLDTLNRLPPELERLTSLQSLYLMGGQLSDLSPAQRLIPWRFHQYHNFISDSPRRRTNPAPRVAPLDAALGDNPVPVWLWLTRKTSGSSPSSGRPP